MDGAKVSFLHVSQNVPTDSPMEVTYCLKLSERNNFDIFWSWVPIWYEGDNEQAKGEPDPRFPGSATIKVRPVNWAYILGYICF